METTKTEENKIEKKPWWATVFGVPSNEERTQKKLKKLIDKVSTNQAAFLEGYRKLSAKYGLDFNAVPGFAPLGKNQLDKTRMERLTKTINRACEQDHVKLIATFKLVPKEAPKATTAEPEKEDSQIIVPKSNIIVPR